LVFPLVVYTNHGKPSGEEFSGMSIIMKIDFGGFFSEAKKYQLVIIER